MAFFKKFFKDIIHDREVDEETVKVKGKKKPKYYGTVSEYPNFSASSDASVLQNAIEHHDVDEDVIISVLVKRNNEQRQKIKVVYEASTGERLEEALESALRSDLEDVTMALIMTPARFDAYELREATRGLGTDEDVLTEILATRTNDEIREIKRVYKEVYGKDLAEVIEDETSGDFTTALLELLKAERDESDEVDMDQVRRDTETLFEAAEHPEGINVAAFIKILTSRNHKQLAKTFQQYKLASDMSLPKALDMELKGDIEDCLIDIVKCAWSTPAFFAEKLHKAMDRHGTCEQSLIRVLVSRSEEDLKKIVEEFRAMYGVSLQDSIVNETDGHYQAVLLGLCGPF
ncbi:annexin A1-like [Notolabrus celidotus]|uniref:annexin A1-like n=1 Tax=Notolabrus celidotus TaxID=1203425 RepID=UPI00149033E0|nr:annexin A1-like [Notolabrus celidotus]